MEQFTKLLEFTNISLENFNKNKILEDPKLYLKEIRKNVYFKNLKKFFNNKNPIIINIELLNLEFENNLNYTITKQPKEKFEISAVLFDLNNSKINSQDLLILAKDNEEVKLKTYFIEKSLIKNISYEIKLVFTAPLKEGEYSMEIIAIHKSSLVLQNKISLNLKIKS